MGSGVLVLFGGGGNMDGAGPWHWGRGRMFEEERCICVEGGEEEGTRIGRVRKVDQFKVLDVRR